MSIGKFASNLILTTSMSNTEVLAAVREQFPAAKTTMACIAWYKSDLRKKNLIPGRNSPAPTTEEKIASLKAQLEALELYQMLEADKVQE